MHAKVPKYWFHPFQQRNPFVHIRTVWLLSFHFQATANIIGRQMGGWHIRRAEAWRREKDKMISRSCSTKHNSLFIISIAGYIEALGGQWKCRAMHTFGGFSSWMLHFSSNDSYLFRCPWRINTSSIPLWAYTASLTCSQGMSHM